MNKDPQKINLSLVSHTNVGKTTLARTLLGRDIGEVGDRSHVTIEPEDYVLLRAPDDSELILWDTPGFGDSVRLAERLKARSNPIGWFTSEIWDRLTDKSLWLNQQAIKHVRDKSLVILYLVNASESPEAVPYVKAEMDILAWVNKPVIVLLNGRSSSAGRRKSRSRTLGRLFKALFFRQSRHAHGRLRSLLGPGIRALERN